MVRHCIYTEITVSLPRYKPVQKDFVSAKNVPHQTPRAKYRIHPLPFPSQLPSSTRARMLTLLLTLLLASARSLAQSTNVSTDDAIRASDGTCLTASTTLDSSGLTLESCNGNAGQRWTLSTSGQHVHDTGFAIIILSNTYACLDVAAVNNSHPGLYSCGGLPGGTGQVSNNQEFTYSTLRNSRGPLVFVARSGWINNGVGPNQSCLSTSRGTLDVVRCDPASPAPEQQFYLGFDPSLTPSRSAATAASATAHTNQASSKRSVNPAAIAVPVVAAVLLPILGFFFIRRYRSARKKAKSDVLEVQTARPFTATPTTTALPSDPSYTPTPRFIKGELPSITNTSGSASPPLIGSPGLTSSSTQIATANDPSTVEQGAARPADIEQIVSMVAARIDASGPRNPEQPTHSSPTDSDSMRTSSPSASSTGPQVQNVNIDTILTMLAARVDPSYRDQTDVRDSRDVPPSYQIPPGYT